VALFYKAKTKEQNPSPWTTHEEPEMSWEDNDEITTTIKSLRLAQEQALVEGGNLRARKILAALLADAVVTTNIDVGILEQITAIVEDTH
jgi:hypothetical protein